MVKNKGCGLDTHSLGPKVGSPFDISTTFYHNFPFHTTLGQKRRKNTGYQTDFSRKKNLLSFPKKIKTIDNQQ
jgi:hypothetical protein